MSSHHIIDVKFAIGFLLVMCRRSREDDVDVAIVDVKSAQVRSRQHVSPADAWYSVPKLQLRGVATGCQGAVARRTAGVAHHTV